MNAFKVSVLAFFILITFIAASSSLVMSQSQKLPRDFYQYYAKGVEDAGDRLVRVNNVSPSPVFVGIDEFENTAFIPLPHNVEEVWLTAPTGNKIYCHLHYPNLRQKMPAIALVNGGYGFGCNAGAVNSVMLAERGFVVMDYHPEGRGKSEGEENRNGPIHQDDLKTVIEYLSNNRRVDSGNIGVVTESFGISTGAGCLARYHGLNVKYLLDIEGPHSVWGVRDISRRMRERRQTTDRDGRVSPADEEDEEYRRQREALTYIGKIKVPYWRVQGENDHALGEHVYGHAIALLNGATEGDSPWTKLNDMEPNIIFDSEHPERYDWLKGPRQWKENISHIEKIISYIIRCSRGEFNGGNKVR